MLFVLCYLEDDLSDGLELEVGGGVCNVLLITRARIGSSCCSDPRLLCHHVLVAVLEHNKQQEQQGQQRRQEQQDGKSSIRQRVLYSQTPFHCVPFPQTRQREPPLPQNKAKLIMSPSQYIPLPFPSRWQKKTNGKDAGPRFPLAKVDPQFPVAGIHVDKRRVVDATLKTPSLYAEIREGFCLTMAAIQAGFMAGTRQSPMQIVSVPVPGYVGGREGGNMAAPFEMAQGKWVLFPGKRRGKRTTALFQPIDTHRLALIPFPLSRSLQLSCGRPEG